MKFLGRAKAAAFPAALVSLTIAVVGGLASVTHLSHRPHHGRAEPPDKRHLHRGAAGWLPVRVRGGIPGAAQAQGRRRCAGPSAVIGAVFGVLLSFMAGEVVP